MLLNVRESYQQRQVHKNYLHHEVSEQKRSQELTRMTINGIQHQVVKSFVLLSHRKSQLIR